MPSPLTVSGPDGTSWFTKLMTGFGTNPISGSTLTLLSSRLRSEDVEHVARDSVAAQVHHATRNLLGSDWLVDADYDELVLGARAARVLKRVKTGLSKPPCHFEHRPLSGQRQAERSGSRWKRVLMNDFHLALAHICDSFLRKWSQASATEAGLTRRAQSSFEKNSRPQPSISAPARSMKHGPCLSSAMLDIIPC